MADTKMGIVGLPNVGKSTLFNALTERSVAAENFPFCTIDPSVGVVAVPDKRLSQLSRLSGSAKTVSAALEFVDIAGLVRGASEGEGLGNAFLSHIREVDAIAEVVRVFPDPDITHVHGEVNPLNDIEVINLELILADQQTLARRLGGIEKEVKRGGKEAAGEQKLLEKIERHLAAGKLASDLLFDEKEKNIVKSLHLLSAKPILYVLNTKNDALALEEEYRSRLDDFLKESGAVSVEIDIGVESDIRNVAEEDKQTFRREFGILESGVDELIRKGYELLDLITFFTTGPDETRGWTVKRGATAKEAGAAIHTDFRDKFIRAEVIATDKLLEAGSRPTSSGQAYAAARDKGWVRTEGKDYIVKDGDVIEFKI